MIEYRVCWSAGSNISFHGSTEWDEWDGFEETEADVQAALGAGGLNCEGLSMALEASGFDWWIETRVAETADA